jgi:membrane dipeptidase
MPMPRTALREQDDAGSRATRLVDDSFVFDSVQVLRTGGPGRPRLLFGTERIGEEYFADWKAAGIKAFMHPAAIFEADIYLGTLRMLSRWNSFVADHTDRLLRIDEPADFDRIRSTGKLGVMLGSHHGDVFRSPEDVGYFMELGLRCCILVTFGQNRIGTAIDEPAGAGLTAFGKRIVASMNQVGMAVDVSHCNDRTRLDAINASSKPVLMSHANVHAICPNVRNVGDEVIKGLAARGGVMGIMPLRMMLTAQEPTTVEHVVDRIAYICDLVGPQHAGIGLEAPIEGFDTLPPENQIPLPSYMRNPGEQRKLDLPELRHARRVYTIAEALVRRGFTDDEIRGILGGNFERVLREILTV